MTKEEIVKSELSGEEIEFFGDSFGNVFDAMDQYYNQALDDAIGEINAVAKNYPGGRTPNGEWFTNPTRDALVYAISLIELHKKKEQ